MGPLESISAAPPEDRARLRARLPALRSNPFGVTPMEVAVGALGLLGAIAAFAVPLTSGTLVHSGQFALLAGWTVVGFVFAGLLWRRVRPWSPIGATLCVFAVAVGFQAFQASSNGVLLGAAVLTDGPLILVLWYLALAFPAGRLDLWGRLLTGLGALLVLTTFVPWFFSSQYVAGGTPLARCGPTCPTNALAISVDAGRAAYFGNLEEWATLIFTILLAATLVQRFRRATRPRRRVVLPVYAAYLAWLASFWVFHLLLKSGAAQQHLYQAGIALTLTRSALPLAFIAAIVLAHSYAGAALETMVHALRAETSPRKLEQLVQRVLDDPGARLAFWAERTRRYVDHDAHPVEPPANGSGQSWRAFVRPDGVPVVAITHDVALESDRDLVGAVGDATVLALENRRLGRDLQQSVDDLLASRKRVVTAIASERRRIERDLHDGAQQQLLAVRVHLELARERPGVNAETADRLGALGADLDHALGELRSITHGIYPPVLSEEGLGAALADAGRRAACDVHVTAPDVPRLPEEIEAAVYFTCAEALQNCVKHAGPGARCRLNVWLDTDVLCFEAADNGRGFRADAGSSGDGLTNMIDRISALGGTLTVDSWPGHGTLVSGRVPIAA